MDEENLKHGGNFSDTRRKNTSYVTLGKLRLHGRKKSDTRRKITSYVALGKLCLHGRKKSDTQRKISGGKIQVMLH